LPWKNWTGSLGTKLLSVVTAVAIWFTATNQIEFEQSLVFPIKYVNWPEGLTSIQRLPETVRARIKGNGKFLRYTLRKGYCRVDLSDSQIGWNRFTLSGGNLKLPGDVYVSKADVEDPVGIRVEFDETVIRDIPVTPSLVGEPDPRFLQVGRTFVNPPVARVKGPRKVIDDIALLATEDIDIAGRRNTVRKRVRLRQAGSETVEINPMMVEIGITIEPAVTRTIENVVLEFAHDVPDDPVGTFAPALMQIEISGARSIVEVASKEVSSVVLRASSWSIGTSVLRFKEVRGRDVVYAPYESFPLVAAPWGAESDPTLIGPVSLVVEKVPPAVEGEVVSTLPLPREVTVLNVAPDRLVVTVREKPPEPELVRSPEPSP
jgi:hypothetical protein